MNYAVVDLETTGLFPGQHDRVVEVSIVRLDETGGMVSEYTTLVNPERDMGPTHIHGIMADDVEAAPKFEAIAGDILHYLRDAVMVAHNAQFDLKFLNSEFQRMEIALPKMPVICTMDFVRRARPFVKGRSLVDLCSLFGIPYENAHSAGADAAATALLFKECLQICGSENLISEHGHYLEEAMRIWPELVASGISFTRSRARNRLREPSTFMTRIKAKLPNSGGNSEGMDEYLALLDQSLLDRVIIDEEAQSLIVSVKCNHLQISPISREDGLFS